MGRLLLLMVMMVMVMIGRHGREPSLKLSSLRVHSVRTATTQQSTTDNNDDGEKSPQKS
jgi:hypothetical protein